MSIHIFTDENFDKEVLKHGGFVLVDFWAEWCGPCRQLTPIVEELASEMQETLKVGKMNVDENPQSPTTYGVRGIPTLILIKDGKQVAIKVGSLPKSALMEWVKSEMK